MRLLERSQWRLLPLLLLLLPLVYLFAVRQMRFFEVPSRSMEPTLQVGDRLVTLKQGAYRRGDIVVLWDAEASEYIVKRIVGLPGDLVHVEGGALWINDLFASEPYLPEPMAFEFKAPVRVGEGQVFVMGDNRNWSYDSGTTGHTLPLSSIVGKVEALYFPLARLGWCRSYPLVNAQGGGGFRRGRGLR
jgi:signal peptidase I